MGSTQESLVVPHLDQQTLSDSLGTVSNFSHITQSDDRQDSSSAWQTTSFSSPISEQQDSSSTLVAYPLEKTPQISTARLFFAHVGAAMTLFLATTDATIVSTILPTITSQFKASSSQYTWVTVTYMLTQTAFQPLYGKSSDLIGRMSVLYSSILIFAVGSALCGAAKSIRWLIAARALAGVGGGGIVSLVWTITSEIVEVQNQAKWSQALSVTWACSAIAGPILGGVFSEHGGSLSWRWAFFLNLPICAVASIILWLSLNHVPLRSLSEISWSSFRKTFDFLGLLLFMGGSSCIVIGFNLAGDNGRFGPAACVVISAGVVILVCAAVYEVRTKRDALFPPAVFKDRTIAIILIVIFLHNFAFNAGTFYLALFFQAVDNMSPLKAGIRMLPYSLGSSLASMPSAWFIAYWQRRHKDTSGQKAMICLGLFIATLGFGSMISMSGKTAPVLQSIFPLISGLGVGMLFHAPYQVFSRALLRKDTASGTSAFFLVRFTGATIGLSVSGAIFESRLSQVLPPGISTSSILDFSSSIQSNDLKLDVVHALSLSIRAIWSGCCACLGAALLISIFMRNLQVEAGRPENASVTVDGAEKPELSEKTSC